VHAEQGHRRLRPGPRGLSAPGSGGAPATPVAARRRPPRPRVVREPRPVVPPISTEAGENRDPRGPRRRRRDNQQGEDHTSGPRSVRSPGPHQVIGPARDRRTPPPPGPSDDAPVLRPLRGKRPSAPGASERDGHGVTQRGSNGGSPRAAKARPPGRQQAPSARKGRSQGSRVAQVTTTVGDDTCPRQNPYPTMMPVFGQRTPPDRGANRLRTVQRRRTRRTPDAEAGARRQTPAQA
jgi:hypothetical protein